MASLSTFKLLKVNRDPRQIHELLLSYLLSVTAQMADVYENKTRTESDSHAACPASSHIVPLRSMIRVDDKPARFDTGFAYGALPHWPCPGFVAVTGASHTVSR
jgi:hypothetical protein